MFAEKENENTKCTEWISESLGDALRKGKIKMKENTDGKANCWKKIYLVENVDGILVYGWAVCKDCNCFMMYKSKLAS